MNLTVAPSLYQRRTMVSKQKKIDNHTSSFTGGKANINIQQSNYPKEYYLKNNISFTGYWEEREFMKLEAENPVKWAQTWDYNERKQHYDDLYEEEISRKWTRIGNKKIRAKYDAQFMKEQARVTRILQVVGNIQDKYDDAVKLQKLNEQIRRENAVTEGIKQRINARLNNPNAGIRQSIGGYDDQIEQVNDGFLTPIDIERANIEAYEKMLEEEDKYTSEELKAAKKKAYGVPIPPSALFYGCFGTGKNTFTRSIAAESGCHLEVYAPNTEEDIDAFVMRVRKESRERYLETGQRTIAVINEAERYFNNSGDEFVDDRVANMRDTLDYCSHNPNNGESGACALSFFFTTNYPKKMTDIGILGRDERMPLVVPVGPAEGKDLEGVLKFYIKKHMPQESSFDVDNHDFSKILEALALSDEKGCFNNDRLRAAIEEIRHNYDKDPEKSFRLHLEEGILDGKCKRLSRRNISPAVYNRYYDDLQEIGEG